MTEEGIRFLSDCIQQFEATDNWLCIIKQNNVMNMSVDDFRKIKLASDKYISYYHEYISADMSEAYEPFLTICRNMIIANKIDVKGMLDRLDIYTLHKNVFVKYFKGEKCNRDEELIVPEVEFEREMFLEDLKRIIDELTKNTPVFLLINTFNLVCSSTVDFLLYLANGHVCENLKIMCISNELGNVMPYAKDNYIRLRKYCEKNKSVYDWPYNIIDDNVEVSTSFVFRPECTTEYYSKIITMINTMAHDQAMYYLGIIYQKFEIEKLQTTSQFKYGILVYYAWLNIYKLNASYALLVCDSIKQIECTGRMKDMRDYTYYYLVANANMYNGNEDDAHSSAENCLEIAHRLEDDFLIFKAMLLLNMSELSGWKEIWICEKEINVPDKLIEDCKKYRYFNHLAHIYVYCYDNDYHLYQVISELKDRIPHVNLGIRIAEEQQNYKFLMEAYRKNVMIASYNGLFTVSSYFYNKSILVAKKTHNKVEEANIYNGLGYNSSSCDHFEEAHEYFCKALGIYFEHKMSDSIVETLYNMGMNAILAEDYKNATQYLITVLDVLRKLKKNSIRVCNISKIFGLVALSTFREGNFYLSQLYLNKAKQFLDFILDYKIEEFYSYLWDDDMFLYYFVSGLTDVREQKYEQAIDNYKKASMFIERFSGSAFFNYPQYMIAYAQVYELMGNHDRYEELLLEGRERCNVMGNCVRVAQFDRLLDGKEVKPLNIEMSLSGVTLEQILELSQRESIEMEASAKKKDIQFFTTFQEMINHPTESIDTFVFNLISTFKNNYNQDNVIFINNEDGRLELEYSDLEYSISEDSLSEIFKYFQTNPSGFAASQFSNNYHEYERILKIFRTSKIFSIVGVPIRKNDKLTGVFISFVKIKESWNSSIDRDIMDEDDLEIFTYVFRQIIDAMDKFKMNQLLRTQAETDPLTGLYNRKMYYDRIDNMIEDAEKNRKKIDISLVYADLDHFKYYNDHFGHNVGDAILVEFAKIFRNVSKELGWAIRFGGDEFLLVLNTANYDEVKNVVDRIYYEIKQKNGFEEVVKEYIDADVSIPEKDSASCSIGVAVGHQISSMDDISIIRKYADEAMYRAKKSGRGYAEYTKELEKTE